MLFRSILVGISYDADIRQAREVIMKVLEEDESVLATKDRRVFVDTLADSGVNLNVRCWADNETYWECKWRITEKIKYALDEAGISIPYPPRCRPVPNRTPSHAPFQNRPVSAAGRGRGGLCTRCGPQSWRSGRSVSGQSSSCGRPPPAPSERWRCNRQNSSLWFLLYSIPYPATNR